MVSGLWPWLITAAMLIRYFLREDLHWTSFGLGIQFRRFLLYFVLRLLTFISLCRIILVSRGSLVRRYLQISLEMAAVKIWNEVKSATNVSDGKKYEITF